MAQPSLGSVDRPLRVAIIGSGPSAFYVVEALQKAEGLHVVTDMFDRLPTPYGLVRGGVAPDHQKIKSVVKIYEKVASHPQFRFFGNVALGRDVQVDDLRAHYDQIVYAVGNESDRRLGTTGEDLRGVHSATEFVGWYNGHPDFADREFDLKRAKSAVVIGNGNVAIDVARVLMRSPDELAETDIADYALETLRESRVREVILLGRRGPAQAAFSPKEIQEIAALDGVDLVVEPEAAALDEISQEWLEAKGARSAKRNVEFLQKQATLGSGDAARKVRCRFLVSPVELLGEDDRVTAIRIQHAELYVDDRGTPRPRGVESFEEMDAQLVFKAIGYRGTPITGVPFDDVWGLIPNDEGRVLECRDGERVPNEYVVGWAKRGPTGLIGTNSPDSKATAAVMLEDLADREGPAIEADDRERIVQLLQQRGVNFVSYQDWQALDSWERDQGEAVGKIRKKLSSIPEMMRVVDELRATRS